MKTLLLSLVLGMLGFILLKLNGVIALSWLWLLPPLFAPIVILFLLSVYSTLVGLEKLEGEYRD